MRLKGLRALVTGGGSGIGEGIARRFVEEGAAVACLGRTASKLERVVGDLSRAGGKAVVVVADQSDEAAVKSAIARTVEALGGLDVLVNNAGVYHSGALSETDAKTLDRVLRTNLYGPFALCREALPHLARSANASILNISSTIGTKPVPGCAAYCISKAALQMMTQVLALEAAPHRVRVNAICPAVVDTPIHRERVDDPQALHAFLDEMAVAHPLGRVGKPEDVAEAAVYLASAGASWTTGVILPVDGGILLA
jgi:NAD(P)-dependent dehydrogenase (short-subunit alcohol dehydrogenase family)